MTGALRHHDRLVGLIHLNSESADAYDTEARRLLASVMPALAALADPTARTGDLHGLPAEGAAPLVAAALAVRDGVLRPAPGHLDRFVEQAPGT